MRRLARYITPYKLAAGISACATIIKSASDVAGPYFVKVTVDTYLAPTGHPGWLARRISVRPLTGINELALL